MNKNVSITSLKSLAVFVVRLTWIFVGGGGGIPAFSGRLNEFA